MVADAQYLGAVVTKVEKGIGSPEKAEKNTETATPAIQGLKNRADLQDWVGEMGWSRDEILIPLRRAGYEDSKAFLAKKGNTVQSLADFLLSELSTAEGDGSW
jgi:hypothetical protein